MNFSDLPEPHQELLGPLFNPECATSLAALLPPVLASRLLNTISQDPDLFPVLGHEDELIGTLERKYKYLGSPTDGRIRMSFWLEYERALLEADKMRLVNIHSLVCDERSFYRLFLSSPGRAAYLICRPAAYQEQVKELLSHGLKRYRQIIDRPVDLPNGKIDHKLLAIQVKIIAMMDMRVHGAPTQKVQQLNVNVETRPGDLAADTKKLVAKGDINAIQTRLAEIEKAMGDGEKQKELPILEAELIEVPRDGGKTNSSADSAARVRAPGAGKVREEE